MELELNAKNMDTAIEAAILMTTDKPICELSTGQLATLIEGVFMKVLAELEKPKELTPLFLSRPQAAAHLGISVSKLDGLIKDGEIPAVMLGKRLMINHDVIRSIKNNGEYIF